MTWVVIELCLDVWGEAVLAGLVRLEDVPVAQGMLEVSGGNWLYWEEWGSPAGLPALYLHGGPGGGLGASRYRERFDLRTTRVIGFEQRGCGRSIPHVSDPSVTLDGQTMSQLIEDIEHLRIHSGVSAWLVNGVSWGSTLALAYALAHPDRVLGIVLYAVTTTSRREVEWITEGVGIMFPEAWDRLAGHAEQTGFGYRRGEGRLIDAYAQLMASPEESVREAASLEWALWEDTHVSISAGGLHRDPRWADRRFRHAFFRLTAHYWSNDGFCQPPILDRTDRLHGIPGVLIHGRRDISSPVRTAWELHQKWPDSTLLVDEGDGHGGSSMLRAWRDANERLAAQRRT